MSTKTSPRPTAKLPADRRHADETMLTLSPSQASLYDELKRAIDASPLVVLETTPGFGKTTLVTQLLKEMPGVRIGLKDLLAAVATEIGRASCRERVFVGV